MFGSKGKIDITIQKTNYAPGDLISGDVTLTLKKPVKAREVSMSLIGEQWVTTYSGSSTGVFGSGMRRGGGMMGMGGPRMRRDGLTIGTRKETYKQRVHVYDFKQQLDGEKEYSEGRVYHFEMKIPPDIVSAGPQDTGAAQSSPVKWYLLAKLDIPGGLDVSKKIDITIG
jgi:hypothetical protein